jgi:GNAT superfamily N-acetyltransferase
VSGVTPDEPPWPVDLDDVRLWPMESEDGPLLQELFDDLPDFRTAFGDPGSADAVSTFLALPEGCDYDAKLLLGVWRNGGLAGALDCIMGHPTAAEWTIGLLVVADRHRRSGIAASVVGWLARTAADRGASRLRAVLREGNQQGLAFAQSVGFVPERSGRPVSGHVVVSVATAG